MKLVRDALRERMGIVTDEVNPDLTVAGRELREWGLVHADIRSIGSERVPHFDGATLAGLRSAAELIRVGSLSPGLFKGALRGAAFEQERDVVLPAVIRLAAELGVDQIIVFGGGRSELLDDVTAVLADARTLAEGQGIELLVENSSLCRVADGHDLLQLVEQVGVRVVWDPANAIASGSTDLREHSRALARYAACVHVRDWHPSVGWQRLGEGTIPWSDLIVDLESEGFVGRFVVESHLPDDPGASEWNVRMLAEMLLSRS